MYVFSEKLTLEFCFEHYTLISLGFCDALLAYEEVNKKAGGYLLIITANLILSFRKNFANFSLRRHAKSPSDLAYGFRMIERN